MKAEEMHPEANVVGLYWKITGIGYEQYREAGYGNIPRT